VNSPFARIENILENNYVNLIPQRENRAFDVVTWSELLDQDRI